MKAPCPLPDGNTLPQAVILADGAYPAAGSVALRILQNARIVVCCDGAADAFISHGGIPEAIVGDCDSLSAETATKYADRIYPSSDQESNDLTKAFEYCLREELGDIIILGATGKREDHTIANVSLLAGYAAKARVSMVTDFGVFDAIAEDSVFESFPGQQVSIFTMGTDIRIGVDNLLYIPPADGLCGWWRGSLNESLGDVFGISTNGETIIFRAF